MNMDVSKKMHKRLKYRDKSPESHQWTSPWGQALDAVNGMMNDVTKDKSLKEVSCKLSLPRDQSHNVMYVNEMIS